MSEQSSSPPYFFNQYIAHRQTPSHIFTQQTHTKSKLREGGRKTEKCKAWTDPKLYLFMFRFLQFSACQLIVCSHLDDISVWVILSAQEWYTCPHFVVLLQKKKNKKTKKGKTYSPIPRRRQGKNLYLKNRLLPSFWVSNYYNITKRRNIFKRRISKYTIFPWRLVVITVIHHYYLLFSFFFTKYNWSVTDYDGAYRTMIVLRVWQLEN